MKSFITILFALFIVINTSAQSVTKTFYTCPMHPEVVKSGPGDCPKCGMTLVKKTVTVKQSPPKTKVSKTSTPVTSKVSQPPKKAAVQKTANKPTATKAQIKKTVKNTAKTSMKKTVDAKPGDNKKAVIAKPTMTMGSKLQQKYTCPMHPEIVSDKPGKCPKCGMNLVQVATDTHDMQMKNSLSSAENIDGEKVAFSGKKVRYDLYVKDTLVNFTGKSRRAIAVNGKFTAPTLYFTEGDTAEIYLHNQLKENTSFHWHGVILPNPQDGVPFLTTKRVKPGETHLYTFKVSQNGTYWYHSHSGVQEQIGMNGLLVFKKRDDPKKDYYKAEIPVVLGEWSDDNPKDIMRRLHTGNTEWYAIKKNAVQSYSEAIKTGNFGTKLKNEWLRQEAMDVSDVYYNHFLMNGKIADEYKNLSAGDKVRLRITNAGSSTYFWLNYGGGKFKVVANDGNDVEPVEVDRLIVGISETYDVEVVIPQNKSYEFRATSEDRTGYSSFWLGSGEKIKAPTLPRLELFEGMKMMNSMMKMSGDMKPMNMTMSNQQMDMNSVMYPEIPKAEREMTMKHMMEMMGEKMNDTQAMPQNHADHNGGMKMETKYTCSMHPEVISDQPGKCPKCGMNLVTAKDELKMEEQSTHSQMKMNMLDKYTCPMHPDVVSDQPGKCPKCGMNLVKQENHVMKNTAGEKNIVTLNYNMLASPEKNILPQDNVKELKFTLEGNMRHYLWTLDNKTVNESDKILIKKGELVRIVMYNNSMMRHPMHLHGHDFRLINAKGEYSPLKNVVDIMPMETATLEFPANQDGDWFFHCHILYHMMSGMGRVFSYENSAPNPQLPDKKQAWQNFKQENRMVSPMAMLGLETHMFHGEGMAMIGPRYAVFGDFEKGFKKHSGFEGQIKAGRYIGKFQWALPYIGYRIQDKMNYDMSISEKTMFGQPQSAKNRNVAIAGIEYLLPFLMVADASVDMNGKFLLTLGREDIPLTPRFRGNFKADTDKEFTAGISYILGKYTALSVDYHNEMGFGAGIKLTY